MIEIPDAPGAVQLALLDLWLQGVTGLARLHRLGWRPQQVPPGAVEVVEARTRVVSAGSVWLEQDTPEGRLRSFTHDTPLVQQQRVPLRVHQLTATVTVRRGEADHLRRKTRTLAPWLRVLVRGRRRVTHEQGLRLLSPAQRLLPRAERARLAQRLLPAVVELRLLSPPMATSPERRLVYVGGDRAPTEAELALVWAIAARGW